MRVRKFRKTTFKTQYRLTKAFGISVFILPVNISFHSALFNSGCFSKALAMHLAASTPNVLPSKFRYSKLLQLLIATTTTFTETHTHFHVIISREKLKNMNTPFLPSSSESSLRDFPWNVTPAGDTRVFSRALATSSTLGFVIFFHCVRKIVKCNLMGVVTLSLSTTELLRY